MVAAIIFKFKNCCLTTILYRIQRKCYVFNSEHINDVPSRTLYASQMNSETIQNGSRRHIAFR